ncbi:MBL fold metallo-hydrolase [Actinophytocola sp.]|uniref:MBL fold metallo-hydrolase n=1 Tax=Actinophytocola sp. TaxID=1872138 RepID=UPI003D6B0F0F
MITHGHEDHAGAAAEVRAWHGAPVHCARGRRRVRHRKGTTPRAGAHGVRRGAVGSDRRAGSPADPTDHSGRCADRWGGAGLRWWGAGAGRPGTHARQRRRVPAGTGSCSPATRSPGARRAR